MSNGAANCSSCIRRRDRCRPLACIQRRGQPRMVLPTPYCHSERSEESSAPCPRPRGSEKQTLRVAQGDRANHCGKIISHGGVRIPSPSSLHFRKTCHSRRQSSGIQVFSSYSSDLHFKLNISKTVTDKKISLNPFFVRSSFQTTPKLVCNLNLDTS